MEPNPKSIYQTKQSTDNHNYLLAKTNISQQRTLSLRKLNLHEDWPVLLDWMAQFTFNSKEFKGTEKYIQQAFEEILNSGFSNPLMCIQNGIPICQIDLFQYIYSETTAVFDCKPDDFGIRLLGSPKIRNRQQYLVDVLQLCLEYIFSLQTVNKVIYQSDNENEVLNYALIESGFKHISTVQLLFYKVDVFIYSRANYFANKNEKCQVLHY